VRLPRLLPTSLLGQVMLVLALGLFVGQFISAFLLYQASEQRREAALVNAVAFRLVAEDAGEERRERLAALRRAGIERPRRADRPFRGGMRIALETAYENPIDADEPRLRDMEQDLEEVLQQQGIPAGEVRITHRAAGEDPFMVDYVSKRRRLQTPGWQRQRVVVAAVERPDQQNWLVTRMRVPAAQEGVLRTIIFQTFVIFVVLFALLYLVVRRLTRPLAQLTARVDDFSRNPDRAVLVKESGPADMRQLISAHNSMEARISALLDEKDVMLGAIGHDLKTPLAALRVRIESVGDEDQRARMAQSIEDITQTLDDILSLARIGRGNQDLEQVDLAALSASVVEEFEDLGQPVTLGDTPRAVARIQVTWLKRALRNLVSNAVRYGGSANVSLRKDEGVTILAVADEGPGIPEDRIADMLEPFTRGEASRNRSTGGAGLGLTLARAIAEQHGGSLSLTNRAEGGLLAELRIPSAHQAAD